MRTLAAFASGWLAYAALGWALPWAGLGLLEMPLRILLIFPVLTLLVRWLDGGTGAPHA